MVVILFVYGPDMARLHFFTRTGIKAAQQIIRGLVHCNAKITFPLADHRLAAALGRMERLRASR